VLGALGPSSAIVASTRDPALSLGAAGLPRRSAPGATVELRLQRGDLALLGGDARAQRLDLLGQLLGALAGLVGLGPDRRHLPVSSSLGALGRPRSAASARPAPWRPLLRGADGVSSSRRSFSSRSARSCSEPASASASFRRSSAARISS
jgi:hypothetical protein